MKIEMCDTIIWPWVRNPVHCGHYAVQKHFYQESKKEGSGQTLKLKFKVHREGQLVAYRLDEGDVDWFYSPDHQAESRGLLLLFIITTTELPLS